MPKEARRDLERWENEGGRLAQFEISARDCDTVVEANSCVSSRSERQNESTKC
jgi:hypothetical protein